MANPNIFNTTSIVAGNATWTLPTTMTTLFTVDAGKIVKVNSIYVAAPSSNATYVYITIGSMTSGAAGITTVGADTTQQIIYQLAVGPTTPVEFLSQPIYMMEGNTLRAYKESTNSVVQLQLMVSYEVIDDA